MTTAIAPDIPELSEDDLVDLLAQAEVLLKGHYVLKAWAHSDRFVDIKGLTPHVAVNHIFGVQLARFIAAKLGPDINRLRGIIGPAIGGITHADHVAFHLDAAVGPEQEIIALFAEKRRVEIISDSTGDRDYTAGRPKEEFYLGRGFDKFIAGGVFVLVEDVITSGSSVAEVVKLIESLGGIVIFVVAIWNRSNVTAEEVGAPLYSLIERDLPKSSKEECQATGQCSRGEPIDTDHGRGAEYVQYHGQPKPVPA